MMDRAAHQRPIWCVHGNHGDHRVAVAVGITTRRSTSPLARAVAHVVLIEVFEHRAVTKRVKMADCVTVRSTRARRNFQPGPGSVRIETRCPGEASQREGNDQDQLDAEPEVRHAEAERGVDVIAMSVARVLLHAAMTRGNGDDERKRKAAVVSSKGAGACA